MDFLKDSNEVVVITRPTDQGLEVIQEKANVLAAISDGLRYGHRQDAMVRSWMLLHYKQQRTSLRTGAPEHVR